MKLGERVTATEVAQGNLKEDVAEIKSDIKEIKKTTSNLEVKVAALMLIVTIIARYFPELKQAITIALR